MKISQKDEILI